MVSQECCRADGSHTDLFMGISFAQCRSCCSILATAHSDGVPSSFVASSTRILTMSFPHRERATRAPGLTFPGHVVGHGPPPAIFTRLSARRSLPLCPFAFPKTASRGRSLEASAGAAKPHGFVAHWLAGARSERVGVWTLTGRTGRHDAGLPTQHASLRRSMGTGACVDCSSGS